MAMPVVLTGTLRAVASDVGSGSCRCLPLYRKHCRIKQKGRGEGRVLFVFHQFVSTQMLLPTVTGK
ncbi:hypothetical protein ACJ7C5_19985 [Nocardiopsis yanglingensis]